MKKLFAIALIGAMAAISACATGVKGSPRRICYDAGIQPGTPEFSSCWRNVAHSQGTVVFDDPEAVALIAGAVAARNATTSVVTSAPPSQSAVGNQGLVRTYMATRKEQDVYDLVGGPIIITNLCYVYAYTTRAVVSGNKLVFVNESKTCSIKQIIPR